MNQTASIAIEAPAKINLFLHILGQRGDGYHRIQSLFCLIDWCDKLHIAANRSGQITRVGDYDWPIEADLTVRAAQVLRAKAIAMGRLSNEAGCAIAIDKQIPVGAGLGGGSSDAASTLMALNGLWGLDLDAASLAQIGLSIGADIPFFIHGESALVEGIGEQMKSLAHASRWFVLAVPSVHVPTAQVYRDEQLARDTPEIRSSLLLKECQSDTWTWGHNDLQPVACRLYPAVARYVSLLKMAAQFFGIPPEAVRMSGSGGSVFCSCANRAIAEQLADALDRADPGGLHRVCESPTRHPGSVEVR